MNQIQWAMHLEKGSTEVKRFPEPKLQVNIFVTFCEPASSSCWKRCWEIPCIACSMKSFGAD